MLKFASRHLATLLGVFLLSSPLAAAPACEGRWTLRLHSANWGDINAHFEMRAESPEICVGQHAASAGVLRLKTNAEGLWRGELQFSKLPPQTLQLDAESGRGNVSEGSMRGPFEVRYGAPAGALRPYPRLAARMLEAAQQQIYRPAALQHPGWQRYAAAVPDVAAQADDDLAFLLGLARQWDGQAFSHFRFWRPNQDTAALLAGFARLLPPGAQAVELRPLREGVALLSLRHFIGAAVRQDIARAFAQLRTDGTRALVIDLRGNQGGEFGGLDVAAELGGPAGLMGVFIGPRWWTDHTEAPDRAAAARAPELQDRSLLGFQTAVRTQALTALWHRPVAQPFAGPVWVLTDSRTASAAELLAVWLRDSGRARLVGQTTRGAMLASVFIDLDVGFKLMLPSADYLTVTGERLEGRGVRPHREWPADQALDAALAELKQPE